VTLTRLLPVSYSVAAANERKAAVQNSKNAAKAAEKAANEDVEWAKGSKGNKKEAEEQKRVRLVISAGESQRRLAAIIRTNG